MTVGFVGSKLDASLFVHVQPDSTLYVLVYIDDIIVTGDVPTSIDWFVKLLIDEFSLKDMGDLYYLDRKSVV